MLAIAFLRLGLSYKAMSPHANINSLELVLKTAVAKMTVNNNNNPSAIVSTRASFTGQDGDRTNAFTMEQEKVNPNGEELKKTKLKKLLAGITLTLMSALCFSITTVIVKYVTDVKPSQMALFRYIGILVFSFPVVLESKQPWFGENNWWWRLWMLLRGLFGCTTLFFRYAALTYISLADATIIMLAMPVFVFIFARIFLGENFGPYQVLALCLSIVGIAFASKIEILFEKGSPTGTTSNNVSISLMNNLTDSNVLQEPEMSPFTRQLIGSLYALGALTIGSLVYIVVRKMRKTHHAVILFNFALISIVEMSLINYAFYDFELPTTGYSAYLIPILAAISFYGQLLLTKAIQIEEAGVVSVVRTSGEAFFAFVFQIIFFHEIPDLYTILGAILVLSSVFLLSFRMYIISIPEGEPLKKKFRFLTR